MTTSFIHSFTHSCTKELFVKGLFYAKALFNIWDSVENWTEWVFLFMKWEIKNLSGLLRGVNEIIYVKERKRQETKFIELSTWSLVMLGASHAILRIPLESNCCYPFLTDASAEVQRGKARDQVMPWILTWCKVHAVPLACCLPFSR